jgi:8-oxo-dGTP diphosphatase
MSRTLLPTAANLIIRHGSHILLIKRSNTVTVWPNFWAFPGGKVDEKELFREAALREAKEEVGIFAKAADITSEVIVMFRTVA